MSKYTAAVITVSDKGAAGQRVDTSGPAIRAMLEEAGFAVEHYAIIPDEGDQIRAELVKCSDELGIGLVLTTGGTGFSPRDVTPEATLAVVEREVRGIPELMRAESCKITKRGCLSRSAAGIRGRTLIINLPGSEKAAKENLAAVLPAVSHGMDMLFSAGSADCAGTEKPQKKTPPSVDAWLKEAKAAEGAGRIGMYLIHNGTVRETARALVREGDADAAPVTGMDFAYDEDKVNAAVENAKRLPGIGLVRVWLNSGHLEPGDDIMLVLIGGDIRPHVIDALQTLVGTIKNECVVEKEIH